MSKSKAKATAPKKAPAAVKAVAKAAVHTAESDGSHRKASLHPRFREISVVMTNGETFTTRSTFAQDVLKLDIDVSTHPAWTKESNFVNSKADKVNAFSNKYSGLNFLQSK